MRFFRFFLILLFPAFFLVNSVAYATEFSVHVSKDNDDNLLYILRASHLNKSKAITSELEGDANDVVIRQRYNFSCKWGGASGIRLSMVSPSSNSSLEYSFIYVFDDNLTIAYAKEYILMNSRWVDPISLEKSVCNRSGNGVSTDRLTNKNYITDVEIIQQGPFALKGVNNVAIKYIDGDILSFVREDVNGETVINEIRKINNSSPQVKTVFFFKGKGINNIIFLVRWGSGEYYKVYGYTYDDKGDIVNNPTIDNDRELSGSDTIKKPFKYKTASSIKAYLNGKA